VAFSVSTYRAGSTVLQLDVHGEVLGAAAERLKALAMDAIMMIQLDTFVIDLHYATAIDFAGMRALLAGYTTAIEHGTRYCALRAHGPVRDALQAAGVLGVLADSEDLGALLLAVVHSG
jgi:anti-anti-sigma regulatory factor